MSLKPAPRQPSRLLIIAAFAALYLIWGSTYLSIRIAIETIPPFFLVGSRFLIAGLLLFVWCLIRKQKVPAFSSCAIIAASGVLMLFVGNGAVTFAEQYLPSGLAAIVVATVPLWFVILDRQQWSFHFSNRLIVWGIVIGFLGVLLLFAGSGTINLNDHLKVLSFFVLIAGSIGWAIGSLISKYQKTDAAVTMKAAIQMLAAGIVSMIGGLLANEQSAFHWSQVTGASFGALLYLIIMGSLVAYMSYIWLLSVFPPSIVGTYAYVNPVVAVFLGWLIVDEAITRQQVIALLVILCGVILVNVAKDSTKAAVLPRV